MMDLTISMDHTIHTKITIATSLNINDVLTHAIDIIITSAHSVIHNHPIAFRHAVTITLTITNNNRIHIP